MWIAAAGLLTRALGDTYGVSTASYLGGIGNDDEVVGVRIRSDGKVVLAANMGTATPENLSPALLNGASAASSGAILLLSTNGQQVLQVTRLAARVYDLAIDPADRIYVAAGTEGLLSLSADALSLNWVRRAGAFVNRVDAGSAHVACLVPSSLAEPDVTPGVGTITLFTLDGTQRTEFTTWGGRHAVDLCVDDASQTLIWIGWRNGYAYTGPYDLGRSITVHIASLFGVSFDYDGTNGATEFKYQAYDWEDGNENLWEDPATFTLNPRFINGPIDLSQTYSHSDITNALADLDPTNDWLASVCSQADIDEDPADWITQDLLGQYLFEGKPKNYVYRKEVESGHDPELTASFIGLPKYVRGLMADTRGLRCSLGQDGKLYGAYESAGGNNIFVASPFDLAVNADNPGGDAWFSPYLTAANHITYFARYEPSTGQQLRGNHILGRLSSGWGNTVRIEKGEIRADADGRIYLGGSSAWGLPIWPHPDFTPKNGQLTFNPFDPTAYLGGSWFMVISSNMTSRLFTTRLTTDGRTRAVDGRVLNGETEPRITWGGYTELGEPAFVKNAIQPGPGYGQQDGFFAVLGGTFGSNDTPKHEFVFGDFVAGALDYRDTPEPVAVTDLDGDGPDDTVSTYPFSDSIYLSPSAPAYPGPPFYGGVRAETLNSTTRKLDNRTGVSSTEGAVVFIQPGTGESSRVHYLVYFDRADEAGLSPSDYLTFDRDSRLSMYFGGNYYPRNCRWVIRDGSRFYVSEDTFTDFKVLTFNSDSQDGRWAEYTPAVSLNFDDPNALFQPRNFTDITGFGYLEDVDTYSTSRYWCKVARYEATFALNGVDNVPPQAAFTSSTSLGPLPLSVTFDASSSTDVDGSLSFYTWDFSDAAESSGPTASHSYGAAGTYNVTLQVWDDALDTDAVSHKVYVTSHLGGSPAGTVAAWGGDMPTGDLQRYSAVNGFDLDLDGQFDDRILTMGFDADSRLSPASSRGATPLYGGFEVEMLNSTSGTFGDRGIKGSGAFRYLGLRFGNSSVSNRCHGVFYLDRSGFFQEGDLLPVSFDRDSSITLGGITRFDNLGTVRWVVREGNSFYASAATLSPVAGVCRLTFSSDEDDGDWAPYDPASDMDFDSAGAVFAPQNFSNITAVGLLVDKDDFTAVRTWLEFNAIEFLGVVDQVPNQLPVASFTRSPASGDSPLTVSFNASASSDPDGSITSYHWDFGDGQSASGVSTTYQYLQVGTYTITLTVTDLRGGTAQAQATVVVSSQDLTAVIGASPASGTAPLTVNFSGSGSIVPAGRSIVSYAWTFGDGGSGSGVSVQHNYTAAGVYTARLTVQDNTGATHTGSRSITVAVQPPVAVISASPTHGVEPVEVSFSGLASSPGTGGGSIVTYQWNFGDGTTGSGASVNHTYSTAGNYLASLTVTDGNGATASRSQLITVEADDGDLDNDGMDDAWETVKGLNPSSAADAAQDGDGDGLSNLQEFEAGTDPGSAASGLIQSNLTVTTSGVATLRWNSLQDGSTPVRTYRVYRSDGPFSNGSTWTLLRSGISSAGASTTTTDTLAGSGYGLRVYRILVDGFSHAHSPQIYGVNRKRLEEGPNYISFPLTPASTLLQDLLPTDALPDGADESSSTVVDVWDQNTQAFTDRYWLGTFLGSTRWMASGTFDAAGNTPVDISKGVLITLRSGQGPLTLFLAGQVPHQSPPQLVVADNGYTLAGSGHAGRITLSQSGLINSGFVGSGRQASSDRVLLYDAATQSFSRMVWYDSSSGKWRDANGAVAGDRIEPGEAFLIKRGNRGSPFTWTKSIPYSTPLQGP